MGNQKIFSESFIIMMMIMRMRMIDIQPISFRRLHNWSTTWIDRWMDGWMDKWTDLRFKRGFVCLLGCRRIFVVFVFGLFLFRFAIFFLVWDQGMYDNNMMCRFRRMLAVSESENVCLFICSFTRSFVRSLVPILQNLLLTQVSPTSIACRRKICGSFSSVSHGLYNFWMNVELRVAYYVRQVLRQWMLWCDVMLCWGEVRWGVHR
jgi:hypothetical protein